MDFALDLVTGNTLSRGSADSESELTPAVSSALVISLHLTNSTFI